MTVDDRARLGFAQADHYDSYRPSYPSAALAFIREAAGMTENSTVVDLAAGTGLMTRLLSPVGRLIAVEPLAEMRRVLAARVPEAEVISGTAERTGLQDAVADAVVVAQAFHWFANPEAVREISRVLRPAGTLALVWNTRDPSDPFMESLYAVLAPHREGSPGHDNAEWREVFATHDSPLVLASQGGFPWEEPITLGHLKGRVLSTSYVALLGQSAQQDLMRRLETLVGSAEEETPVLLKHVTKIHIARRP